MIEDLQSSDQPYDRLTRLTEEMTDAIDRPENADLKCIIFLTGDDGEGGYRGGIQMFGYEDTASGMADLMVHMKAIFQAMGKDFGVMTDQGVMLMDEG